MTLSNTDFSTLFLLLLNFVYMNVLPICSLCSTCMPDSLREYSREDLRFPRTGVTGGFELPCSTGD